MAPLYYLNTNIVIMLSTAKTLAVNTANETIVKIVSFLIISFVGIDNPKPLNGFFNKFFMFSPILITLIFCHMS